MTRKEYVRKLQALVIAVYRKDGIRGHGSLGKSLRHVRDSAKDVPAAWGSYDAAWNCDFLRWARHYYLEDRL